MTFIKMNVIQQHGRSHIRWVETPHTALLHPACLVTVRCVGLPQVNADVFPFLFGNNVGWVMYASLTHNFYMFVACFPSVMLAMFYILTGYMLAASDAARVRIEVSFISKRNTICGGLKASNAEDTSGYAILGVKTRLR